MFTSHSFGISPTATRAFEGLETRRELSSRTPSRGKPGCFASFLSPAPIWSCKFHRKYFFWEAIKAEPPRYLALALVTLTPIGPVTAGSVPLLLHPLIALDQPRQPAPTDPAGLCPGFFLFFFFFFFYNLFSFFSPLIYFSSCSI